MLSPMTPERLAELERDMATQFGVPAGPSAAAERSTRAADLGARGAVSSANVDEVNALGETRVFVHRGVRYLAPATPYREGKALELARLRFGAHTTYVQAATLALFELTKLDPSDERRRAMDDALADYEAELAAYLPTLKAVVDILGKLVRPTGWRSLVPPRWRRNPFWNASEEEIGAALDFFSARRTQSRTPRVRR